MKWLLILLTVLVVFGTITGIVLVVSEKIAFAGVVWAVTVILSCVARRVEPLYRKARRISKRIIPIRRNAG